MNCSASHNMRGNGNLPVHGTIFRYGCHPTRIQCAYGCPPAHRDAVGLLFGYRCGCWPNNPGICICFLHMAPQPASRGTSGLRHRRRQTIHGRKCKSGSATTRPYAVESIGCIQRHSHRDRTHSGHSHSPNGNRSSRTSSHTLNTPTILNNVNLVQPWRAKKMTIPLSPLRALPL